MYRPCHLANFDLSLLCRKSPKYGEMNEILCCLLQHLIKQKELCAFHFHYYEE